MFIPKKKMSKSYTFKIESSEITTTVVTDESKLECVLKLLFSEIKPLPTTFHRVVGLGIEKSFSYSTTDGVMSEKIAVLKLCAENDCLIVHLLQFKKIPTCLAKFLDVSDIMVVGVGIKQNLCDLRRDYGIECRNAVFELGDLAVGFKKNPVLSSFTLPSLYKFVQMSIGIGTCQFDVLYGNSIKSADVAFSDWGCSELSEKQIFHASMEVHASVLIAAAITQFMHLIGYA
jgi:hypothetical protein